MRRKQSSGGSPAIKIVRSDIDRHDFMALDVEDDTQIGLNFYRSNEVSVGNSSRGRFRRWS